ncbi:RidA family protein [Paenibacillus thalictri]|uniref:RidA family protein n=1 Tax=Paenibacillus thalictri TaxID=2527873 RepID=A0A4V2J3J5_9BACL|nr:RidA family protein [Paenibacillus thalictri]TBL72927.1 RidA family protein [Paenibacillus thalictri]
MEKRELVSSELSTPLGVYSQATEVTNFNKMVFVSGFTSRDNDGGVIGKGDIVLQTETILQNMQHVLAESGGTLADVVKLTVFIRDMEMFKEIHDVRRKYFQKPYPAASMVEVSRLVDPDHLIEIEAIAVIG